MKPRRLNRRLVLETPQRVADGSGGFAVTWQPLGTLWAEITPRTGREAVREGAPVSETNYKIVVRGAPVGDPARPAPDQRLRDGTRSFHIQAVVETDFDARYLTCFATEEVAQ
ncbi:MAG: phage head closure protein [Pseudomonadota bacterium]